MKVDELLIEAFDRLPALVRSAVEGLSLITPAFEPYVLPITLAIIAALFVVQRWGTGTVSALFGPVIAIWYVTLAALGLMCLWFVVQAARAGEGRWRRRVDWQSVFVLCTVLAIPVVFVVALNFAKFETLFAPPSQCRPVPAGRAVPRRMAAARIVWPSGSSVAKHWPTSNRATSS